VVLPGVYIFTATNCSKEFSYKLFNMGFIPGVKLRVISNNGGLIIKIKESKIALNMKTANGILLKWNKQLL
jgi:Fe2+ transport system protein FeoA